MAKKYKVKNWLHFLEFFFAKFIKEHYFIGEHTDGKNKNCLSLNNEARKACALQKQLDWKSISYSYKALAIAMQQDRYNTNDPAGQRNLIIDLQEKINKIIDHALQKQQQAGNQAKRKLSHSQDRFYHLPCSESKKLKPNLKSSSHN